MDQSITTRKSELKNPLVTKKPKVNDDALQPGGALARRINHDNPHCSIPVTGSVVDCKICQWASGENIIAQVQVFILCNVNMCVKHFVIFHTSRTLVEDR